jgi:ribosomal protein S27AE
MAASIVQFPVSLYRPSGVFSWKAIATVLGVSVMAGTLIGFAVGFVHTFFYLVLLFPLLVGIATGKLAAAAVRAARLRNPIVAGLCALFGGAIAMPIVHGYGYLDLQRARAQLDPEALATAMGMSPDALPADVKASGVTPEAIRTARVTSLPLYFDLQAHEGVRIGRSGWLDIRLGHAGSYVYWALELLLAAAVAFALAYRAAAAPFCERCGRWMAERRLGGVRAPADEAVEALRAGDLDRLHPSPPTAGREIRLTMASCPQCGTTSAMTLRLDRVRVGRDGKETASPRTLAHATYPGEAIPVVEDLFAGR